MKQVDQNFLFPKKKTESNNYAISVHLVYGSYLKKTPLSVPIHHSKWV